MPTKAAYVSPCHQAPITGTPEGALPDGALVWVGRCPACGGAVSRTNLRTLRTEWLDDEPDPFTTKTLRQVVDEPVMIEAVAVPEPAVVTERRAREARERQERRDAASGASKERA